MRLIRLVAICLCGIAVGVATAQEADRSRLAAGVQIGSVGVGPVVTYSFSEWLAVRGDFGWLKLTDYEINSGGTEYLVDVDYASGGLMLDLYPGKGPLRFTGGVRLGNNSFGIDASVADSWKVGGVSYPTAAVESITGTVEFDRVIAPYVGIGLGNPARAKRWLMMLDVGVVFQSATASLSATGPVANIPEFQENLAAEEATLQEELDKYELYPVVTFILGCRF